jgi:outer membrane protein assembly factor BamA
MRLWFKLLVVLTGSALMTGSLAEAQNRLLINDVTIKSDQLTKSDIEELTQPLQRRGLSANEIRSRVIFALQNLGYFRASADEPRVQTESDHGEPRVNVSIVVHEGARYHVAGLQVDGATAFSSSRLQDLFPVSAGDWCELSSISMGLNSLLRLYTQAGYPNATGAPQLKVDDMSHTIEFFIDVQEGEHTSPGQEMPPSE